LLQPLFTSAENAGDPVSDEDLVRTAMAGDPDSFDRLVRRYAGRLFRIVHANVGDRSLAEDLVQDALVSAFVALPQYRFRSRFFTWLYRITLNTVRLHNRNAANRRDIDERRRRVAPATGPTPASAELDEQAERIWNAVAELPEEFRTALLMRELGELSYAEIADALGCPIGTVDSRIARARQLLMRRLAPHDDV
jgi:RNA polymerase sigma-70 factor, ECF subfamily